MKVSITIRYIILSIFVALFGRCSDSSPVSNDGTVVQYHCNVVGKKIYLTGPGVYIDGKVFVDPATKKKIEPGDTIVLKSNIAYTYVSFEDVHGDTSCPVTVVNEGGQVKMTNGFGLSDTTYFIINGSAVDGVDYGFHISDYPSTGVGPGVDINHKSAHIEVHHVDIFQKQYGFVIKQDPLCDDQYNYPNWQIDDISVHNNQIINTGQEGMYIGNTAPNGIGRTITCCGTESCASGETRSPIPARLSNVRVNDNIVQNNARAGIQYSDVASGTVNEIYRNYIYDTGSEHNPDQGGGIVIGGDAFSKICGNYISHTWNSPIIAQGFYKTLIENNHVDHCGVGADGSTKADTPCFYYTTHESLPDQIDMHITQQHNSVENPTNNNYYIFLAYVGTGTWDKKNNFCDAGSHYVDANIDWSSQCETTANDCDSIKFIQPPK